jgi:hypothetical protein
MRYSRLYNSVLKLFLTDMKDQPTGGNDALVYCDRLIASSSISASNIASLRYRSLGWIIRLQFLLVVLRMRVDAAQCVRVLRMSRL